MGRDLYKDFHYIQNEKTGVLFHNKSLNYYRVFDENIKKYFKSYFIDHETRFYKEVESILDTVTNEINNSYLDNYFSQESYNGYILEKLVIIVTNNCNCRCKYCYANGGSYGLDVNNMKRDEAKNIIDYFVKNFRVIYNIQIFGGEPMLNYDVIKVICEYFENLRNNNIIDYMPQFGIVTNGTYLPSEAIDIMKKFRFNITISLDGDKIIHDSLRIKKTGEGTFNYIKTNYIKMIESGINKEKISFECTYTHKHIENNISFVDLFKFFRNEFDCLITHITPVCIEKNNFLSLNKDKEIIKKYIKEAVEYTFDTILKERIINSCAIITEVIQRLIRKIPMQYICPAGVNNLTVTQDGTIYPCFMFIGTDLSVGNINISSDEIMSNTKMFNLKFNAKFLDDSCKTCWAKYICSFCLGSFGDIKNKDRSYGAEIMCIMMKEILENVLLKLAELKASEENWQILHKVLFYQDEQNRKTYS
ncbi:uncharacterized protein M2349_000037 [Caldanaerobacter subterraneus subsp. tengcongensis MB4]|uniref:Predicted Fe-S oxidoreductases n=1 Tax=Caldanaerobacter subterraneus subsp. tengcongensis (strain DSM 15242 / JCM 11007 / NBRC 100824 / MB4) TaxID=273068 RepID=Q8R7P4_CALS4|nr:radical SAM protein [Caldanaerobacter subterraneus]AAM25497.1 predicted Fe-S oxidoreductases [Caldanaerobacter subterraneus subsp. tengcongensis MB4]MCS3914896.1 uncharacterized protein [Caldanaerobacter subterraneus subsp. tengcongensis MB4]